MARRVSTSLDTATTRERFVAAGLGVLREHGAAELTVRRVAQLADASTMGIYSSFGSRLGMLEAVYRRGFELLRDELATVPPGPAAARILGLARAYRRFALDNPALYALMFERPLPDFDPSTALRSQMLGATFDLLTGEVARLHDGDPVRPAYLIWTAVHGLTSLELTHAVRSPLPGWFVDSPEAGEAVLDDGVRAVLAGLALG